jgi:hypothetical protein
MSENPLAPSIDNPFVTITKALTVITNNNRRGMEPGKRRHEAVRTIRTIITDLKQSVNYAPNLFAEVEGALNIIWDTPGQTSREVFLRRREAVAVVQMAFTALKDVAAHIASLEERLAAAATPPG